MSSLTKAYRIKNTGAAQGGQTSTGPNPLTRVSKVSASLQNAKLPQMSATPKPIPNLPKFSELAALEYKDTLINTIIEEHLLKFGYLEAFDMFAYEADMIKKLHMLNENMNKKKTPGAVNASMGMSQSQLGGPPVSVRELQDTILKAFADGEDKTFFANWQRILKRASISNPDTKVSTELDLKLQAYFAIYHIHPDIKSPLEDEELVLDTTATKLEEFKAYLESKTDLIVDEDIYMQYEGLTYVLTVDIDKNEKIKHIFEKQWLLDLRAELTVAIENMTENLGHEEHTTSQLQEIVDRYYRLVPRVEGAAETDFQVIEMQAEKLSADIEQRRTKNNRKKEQLNVLANKYELLKTELEMIDVEVAAQISAVEEYRVKPLLIVEQKTFDKILEDRQRLEDEMTRDFVAKATKKGKVSRDVVRDFKMEFNQKMDAQFDLIPFKKASEKEQLQREEEIWKRIMMEYTNILENTMFLKEALPSAGSDADNFAAIIKQNELKLDEIERVIEQAKPKLEVNSSELENMLTALHLNIASEYDKGYVIDGKEVLAYLQSDDQQSVQASITYLNMQVALDPAYASKFDISAVYESVYTRLKKTLSTIMSNSLDTNKDYIKSQKLEFQSSLALLASLVSDEANSQEFFDPAEATNLLVSWHAYLEDNEEELKASKEHWSSLARMELSLLRFLMQGLHSSYRIDEEAPMKTLVSIYLNSKEYPIPVSCRAEVKATLLSGLIICSSSFEKLFDTEKDKIIERALLDLGPRSPLYLNLAALGALIVLSLSDLLSVTKSKSPSGKSFRAVLEGELMKIEEVCNKEGLWIMLNAILKGKFKKEDEQKIISEVEMLASRNANTIPKVILSYDTRAAEVSLWKQLENDLDEQKRDLLEEFEHETINKQSSKKSLLAQKKAQQLQSAAKVNPLNEDKTKPEPNTDTNPGLKTGTQKDVEIPEDVGKQQTDNQPQPGQTPSNPTGAPKQDLPNSNTNAPSKPELGQPPVTQLPGQEAKPPITDNKDPVKKSQVEDPKHIKPPTEVKVDPQGATKLDKDAPVDKVQDKQQDKAKGQDAGPTVPKPDAKKSSNLPKSPNAEPVAPGKTGQPQPKPKKE